MFPPSTRPALLVMALLICSSMIGVRAATAEPLDTANGGFRSVTGPTTAVNEAPSEDIRDIRGPKAVLPAWIIPTLIALGMALAVAAYALWRRKRRRRPIRPLLPFEIALQRLEEIRALMQPTRVREFSIAITDIVRAYIEQRFDVTATHLTTEEFLHDLLKSSQTALASHRELLAQFLQQCDLAKFAGVSLSQRNMESLHDSARAFVLETAKPEALAAGTAAPEETDASLPAT